KSEEHKSHDPSAFCHTERQRHPPRPQMRRRVRVERFANSSQLPYCLQRSEDQQEEEFPRSGNPKLQKPKSQTKSNALFGICYLSFGIPGQRCHSSVRPG